MRKLAAELGIADQVRFIGHCGSIPALLAASDVCVLSSKSEGFSNSILEYMAAGRPVVATNVGGASEAVLHGVNGYIVNVGDNVKMAERITSLLLSPEQSRKMGEIGRGFVTERFSSEVQLAVVEAIYDRLIETSRTASRKQRQGAGRRDRPARLPRASEPGDVRVLIVAPSLDILGGQAIQADRLLSRLKKADGVQASLQPINPRLPGPLASLQRIKYVRTLVTSVLYVASLLLRSWRADVLHVFSASYLSFILAPAPAILIGRLFGKKVILNYRSGEAEDHLRRWPRSSAPVMRLAHRIAVPSGYLVDVFRHFGMRAVSIHNFVDLKQFAFRARPVLRPVFLSNRNLEPNYNVACILRAFSIIQSRFPEARLTIAGDGSLRRSLETLASELGLKNVEFVGRIGNDRMHELYDRSDIYLNGSDVDNMPGSLIEAFASGTPVVTTNAGGIPYIVSDRQTGLVVPVGDYRALASSAASLLEDQALAQSIIRNAYAECRKLQLGSNRPRMDECVFGDL
jgi:glycosyltransferase involved in cell wall biosynthesis